MSGWFITALVMGFVVIIATIVAKASDDGDNKAISLFVAIIAAGVMVLTSIVGSTFFVGAKELGVVTSFGKVTGVMEPGAHWAAPWSSVEKYPTSLQVIDMRGRGKSDSTPCVEARIANGTLACTDVVVQFRLAIESKDGIKNLYREYRSFGSLKDRLVIPQIRSVVNNIMETHDPFSLNKEQNPAIEEKIKTELQNRLGSAISVVSVMRGVVDYDDQTDQKLSEQGQAAANTAIAEQNALTNAKQAEANRALAGEASRDPAVLYQNCLTTTRDLVAAGKQLPATWTCIPPWVSDQQTSAIVGNNK